MKPVLQLPAWIPPAPRELPELRARMVDFSDSSTNLSTLAMIINAGQASMLPLVDGVNASVGSIAAQLLSRLETRRLREAALYWVDEDMTSLALAAASQPPVEPVTADRLPAPSGFMVFAQPIGGYTMPLADTLGSSALQPSAEIAELDLSITTPIVAVSWSRWTPRDITISDGPTQPRWVVRNASGTHAIPPDFDGVWVTFYSCPERSPFTDLPPDLPLADRDDGEVLTARDFARIRAVGRDALPLRWDNESAFGFGHPLGPAVPDTCMEWMHVIYTAWQLMSQSGNRQLAEVEQMTPPRAARRRAERDGTTLAPVTVVHVHTRHRPRPAAAEEDAAASTGRRAPQWSCRWPVAPYRRNTCMAPRRHADGGCRHEDTIVPGHIRGPQDMPLRVRDTVNVWDHMPD